MAQTFRSERLRPGGFSDADPHCLVQLSSGGVMMFNGKTGTVGQGALYTWTESEGLSQHTSPTLLNENISVTTNGIDRCDAATVDENGNVYFSLFSSQADTTTHYIYKTSASDSSSYAVKEVDGARGLAVSDTTLYIAGSTQEPTMPEDTTDLAALVDRAHETVLQEIVSLWGVHMNGLADQVTTTNAYLSFWDFTEQPRLRLDNTPDYATARTIEAPWAGFYAGMSTANQIIRRIEQEGETVTIDGEDRTQEVLASAYMMRGVARGYVGMIYDQGYLFNVDPDSTRELVPYDKLIAAAEQDLNTAMTTADGVGSSDFAWDFLPNENDSFTLAEFKEVASSFAARFLINEARTNEEAAGWADSRWQKILNYAENGVGFGNATQNFVAESVGDYEFFHTHADWETFIFPPPAGYLPNDIKQQHLLDPGYPVDYPTEADSVLPAAESADPRLQYFNYVGDNFGFLDPSRNRALFTSYADLRMNGSNNWGRANLPVPFITGAEMQYVKAEANFWLGDTTAAATALNNSPRGENPIDLRINLPAVQDGKVSYNGNDGLAAGDSMTASVGPHEFVRALHKEYSVELHLLGGMGIQWFFMRRHDLLQTGTPLHYPVPGIELETTGRPYYTFGGAEHADEPGTADGSNTWKTFDDRHGLSGLLLASRQGEELYRAPTAGGTDVSSSGRTVADLKQTVSSEETLIRDPTSLADGIYRLDPGLSGEPQSVATNTDVSLGNAALTMGDGGMLYGYSDSTGSGSFEQVLVQLDPTASSPSFEVFTDPYSDGPLTSGQGGEIRDLAFVTFDGTDYLGVYNASSTAANGEEVATIRLSDQSTSLVFTESDLEQYLGESFVGGREPMAAVSSGEHPGQIYAANRGTLIRVSLRPRAPSNIGVTQSDQRIVFGMPSEPAGLAGYDIYRSTSSFQDTSAATRVNSGFVAQDTAYVDDGLTNGTTYHYRVAATDAGGTRGAASDVLGGAPIAPLASGTISLSSDDTLEVGDTGIQLGFSGVTGEGDVTVEKYDNPPAKMGWVEESFEVVSSYRFLIEASDSLSFEAAELRFDVSTLGGIEDPTEVFMQSRPVEGSGSFGSVGVSASADSSELVAEVSDFSEFMFASQDTSNTLPVELATFDAIVDDGAVRLTWQTASETGNARFEVQRRVGERANGGEGAWTKVGSVEGSRTTTEAQSYRFTDADLPYAADRLGYRLRQVDTDGSAHLSETVTVEREVSDVELLGTYPNPAQSRATVRYALPETQDITIRLYDVLGRQVRTVVRGEQSGRHERQLDTSGLPSGVYFMRLEAGETVRTQKLTVVR